LLASSGPRKPCPGKLGVVEERARANLLPVDGNSVDHLELIKIRDRTFLVIMKDGNVQKNTLAR
jgi:hypothetical protein